MGRQGRVLTALFIAALALAYRAGGGAVPAGGGAEIDARMPEPEEKMIALTFDDGPRQGTTDRLLDGLGERGAKATFFLIGEELAGREDLVRRMAAEGHQIGNHTWSHVRLGKSADLAAEVERTDTALTSILGGGSYWLRPPYGLVDEAVEGRVRVPMVKWSVDPRDWESRNTEKVVQAVLSAAEPNAIVLLHDIYPTSVDAALQVVDALQAEGYRFVTVEELLAANGVTPEAGTLYRTGRGRT